MLMNLLPISGRISLDVVTPGVFENISGATYTTNEPGYVVVYVDNQSIGKDVWFDNVQVLHYNTQVLEENHYYLFGLRVSSSKWNFTLKNFVIDPWAKIWKRGRKLLHSN